MLTNITSYIKEEVMVDFGSLGGRPVFLLYHLLLHVLALEALAFGPTFLARAVALAKLLQTVALQALTLRYFSVTAK